MPQLEDIGKNPGGDALRSFLSVGHNDDGTIGGTGSISLAGQKKIILSSDGSDAGAITRLIELRPSGSIVDRPWISWFDFTSGAQAAAIGAHNTLPAGEGGTQILQWELKTIADPAGPNPSEMRTRIGVKYNTQRGIWGVNFIDLFEINQGENPILTTPGSATATGLRIRSTDSLGTNAVVAQFLATIDSSDNVVGNLDILNTGQVAKTANLVIGRNTNTSSSSGSDILVKKMDGSNTTVFQFRPRTSPPLIGLGYTGDTGVQLVINSDTGLSIGTTTAQKLGHYGITPVVQQNSTGNTHTVAAGSTTSVFTNTTFDGSTGSTAYTLGDIVKALKAYGLLAA